LKDKRNKTAFTICLQQDNAPLLEFLKDKVSINNEPELLFAFEDKILNVEYQRILESLIQNELPTPKTMNYLNSEGYTPFLAYVDSFTRNHDKLLNTIYNKIN
jgi:S-adenosylmethionine:tRNA-ribosyltransferase-isomerase (queuine synthetase)